MQKCFAPAEFNHPFYCDGGPLCLIKQWNQHNDPTPVPRKPSASVRVKALSTGIYTSLTTDRNARFSAGYRAFSTAFPLSAKKSRAGEGKRYSGATLCGGRFQCANPELHHPRGFVAASDRLRRRRYASAYPHAVELELEQEADERQAQVQELNAFAAELAAKDAARAVAMRAEHDRIDRALRREVDAMVAMKRAQRQADWKKAFARTEEMRRFWLEVAQEDRDKPARPSTNVDECPTDY